MKPVLVGLMHTFFIRIFEPGVAAAHTAGKAAEDGSDGTVISRALSFRPGDMQMLLPLIARSAPK